jgi:hypothetical protein
MNANSFTHYQTSFKVEKRSVEVTALIKVQRILFEWVRGKEPDKLFQNNSNDFFYRCDWSNLYSTRSSIATNTFKSNEFVAWALRYTEQDRELGPRRYWYTDVGIKDENDIITFYARISYARSHHDLSFENPIPVATVPNFIRRILQKESGLRVFCGRQQFGLFDRPVPVWKPGHGKVLCDFILSPERSYPMVVFNGDLGCQSGEATNLAAILAGKAQVLVIKEDADLAEEIRHYLRQELRVPFGKFRVFFPLKPQFPRPERHRWYDIQDQDYPAQRNGIINGLLRNFELREELPIRSISEIGRLITLAKLGRFKDSNPQQTDQLNEFYGLLTDAENQRDEYRRESEQWVQECDLREKDIYDLRSRLIALDAMSRESQTALSKARIWDTFDDYPSSLIDILLLFRKVHPDRILVTEHAVKAARDYTTFTNCREAWRLFFHLCTTLYEMRFGTDRSTELEEEFKRRSGCDLSMSEGKQTKRDAELMKLRYITYDDVEYDITPHLKWGNREPKMLRVHFAFDEVKKLIVVGYIGAHLDNSTTRIVK